jgi:hypothetical protein
MNENISQDLINLSFSQEFKYITAGFKNGFKIYTTLPFKLYFEKSKFSFNLDFLGGIRKVEMIEVSNMLAILGEELDSKFKKNKIIFWNKEKNNKIGKLKFLTEVLSVKFDNKK